MIFLRKLKSSISYNIYLNWFIRLFELANINVQSLWKTLKNGLINSDKYFQIGSNSGKFDKIK